jgi:streptogramin lyase
MPEGGLSMSPCLVVGRVRRRRLIIACVVSLLGAGLATSAASADAVGQITEFTGPSGPGTPTGIAAGADGNLWFTDFGAIGRITPSGQIAEFPAGLVPYTLLGEIALGSDGNMWFTDPGSTPAIGQISPDGQVTEFPTGLAGAPDSLTAGPDGEMWFTDDGTIWRISLNGQITSVPTGLSTPQIDITAGSDGTMWFITRTGEQSASVGRISPGGQVTEFPVDGTNASNVHADLAVGPDGNMWFSFYDVGQTPAAGNHIGRISPDGQITAFSDGLQQDELANSPTELAAGPDGNMWFTLQGSLGGVGIGRISPSGQITEWATDDGPIVTPDEIAAGPDGNMWFSDPGLHPDDNGAIGRIGTGAPPAVVQAPSVTGPGEQGTPQDCRGEQWAAWDSPAPSTSQFGFDGYRWQLDGTAIAGQTASSYTPAAADVGHQLSCSVTVTYPLLDVTQTATSTSVTVTAQPTPPPANVELVICTRPRWDNRPYGRTTREHCATRQITGVITSPDATARATLSRYATTYATGTMTTAVDGTRQLSLHAFRWVGPGRYRLTLGLHRHTETTTVTIS